MESCGGGVSFEGGGRGDPISPLIPSRADDPLGAGDAREATSEGTETGWKGTMHQ